MIQTNHLKLIRSKVRDIPDYPKPGILFKDITPVLADGEAFRASIDMIADRVRKYSPHTIVGIESRGFIFGAPVAERLGIGFAPARKPGKLPHKKLSETYSLEYGEDSIEMHEDSVHGRRVVVVDDLLATGGTAAATVKLCQRLGAQVVGVAFLIELAFLQGRSKLAGLNVDSIVAYDS